MSLRAFRRAIRSQDTFYYRLLIQSYFWIHAFHLPVFGFIKPIFRLIHSVSVLSRDLFDIVFKVFYVEPVLRSIFEEVGSGLRIERLPYVRGHGRIRVGNHVHISGKLSAGFGTQLSQIPILCIGDHTFIGHGFSVRVASSVRIGAHCYLGPNIRIYDVDGHPQDYLERRANQPVGRSSILPVTIEDDVWIGVDTIILKGVTIGARSIVGAGSVVTKSIPPDSLAIGNPAKVIRSFKHSGE